jgi:hypothetical protein
MIDKVLQVVLMREVLVQFGPDDVREVKLDVLAREFGALLTALQSPDVAMVRQRLRSCIEGLTALDEVFAGISGPGKVT